MLAAGGWGGDEGGHFFFGDVVEVVLEDFAGDGAFSFDDSNLFGDVFEFADVAVPRVVHEVLAGVFGKEDGRHVVFLGHVGGEFAEEEGDVVDAFAERRDVDGDLLQTVVEVFAEMAVADSGYEVDIGGGDDTDVDFERSGGAYGDDFSIFKYAEQLDLHGQWEFADFVEEDGAAVGFFEVAFAVFVGAGESTFDMAEEFAFDGSFGDGTTVDGNKATALFGMFAEAVFVDDAREDVFAHAAFAGDEDAEVGWGNLNGFVDGHEKLRIVADDAVALFYCLNVHCIVEVFEKGVLGKKG